MNIAKGRTNIELRERFILADGVSQGMVAFKSKPLVNPKTGEINSVGPITKVCKSTLFNIHLNLMQTVCFIDLTQHFVKLSDNIFCLKLRFAKKPSEVYQCLETIVLQTNTLAITALMKLTA